MKSTCHQCVAYAVSSLPALRHSEQDKSAPPFGHRQLGATVWVTGHNYGHRDKSAPPFWLVTDTMDIYGGWAWEPADMILWSLIAASLMTHHLFFFPTPNIITQQPLVTGKPIVECALTEKSRGG